MPRGFIKFLPRMTPHGRCRKIRAVSNRLALWSARILALGRGDWMAILDQRGPRIGRRLPGGYLGHGKR